MNAHFVLNVFAALVDYMATQGKAPTVRELCAAIGWNGEKEVWWALQVLEDIGQIRWPIGTDGKRVARGIELLIGLNQPIVVPIVGYINAPADFIPGTQWIEFHTDGRIVVVEEEERWAGTIVSVS